MSLIVSLFLAILKNSAMGTALLTIVQDIHGSQFLWVLIVYGLTSAALVPLSGSFAEIFGRRPMMLLALFLFAAGSAIGGAAQNMNMLLAARAIQGAGGGSIFALTQIILLDIVTLKERGKYSRLFGFTWAIVDGIVPVVEGGLAKQTTWCWLFYLNIPIAGAAMFLILLIIRLPTPSGTLAEKVRKIDVIGQILVMAHVLTPLVIGLVRLVVFGVYEAFWCPNPIVSHFSHFGDASSYVQIFLVIFIFTNYIYYLSVYYQVCKDASSIAFSVDIFLIAFTITLISVIAGASAGWALTIVGFGLLSTIRENTSHATLIGFQILPSFGIGLVYYTTLFSVLAPLPITLNAHALSLSIYLHAFAQVWGVTLGGTILQNGLKHKLSAIFTSVFDTDTGVAYSIIPQIPHLQKPFKDQVRATFAQSLAKN
ncbi:MFS general substrate transporter [Obba rivulosa]|uniref:MFS general substrate transporter n=1 Tax=Obba rivulosa TaxID=1052685 RepID=A0A8E2ANN2_9APHY|nr:MFS general substrate transporter [Obba rivulosa]